MVENVFHSIIYVMVKMTVGTIQMKRTVKVKSMDDKSVFIYQVDEIEGRTPIMGAAWR